ncbi:EamA/RhaT family transporter [Mucilaginibacter sp. Bleaf8]|uniref:EamA family transporter n=1 Tax=Mucilaginibacter sp. Bleaf8 TaxID=2834430 RepID=UPI001BCC6369|nr:EamA/RhaT family transporter [Mucilaginibacter sp. Bleaf8]MBS7563128.1 EamA/RhaT family transporter [Mucilaginibacter sp. Bleaf8]
MIYIFLSVCCSVLVSVILKLARRYQINVVQAITWNYSIAALLTWLLLKPDVSKISYEPNLVYTSLGILLPGIFFIMAVSVRMAGIVRTDVAQRLSLLISLSAAFLWFHDTANIFKIIGIVLGFGAIACLIPWQKQQSYSESRNKNYWVYLIAVFLGFGFIDILFKQMALNKTTPYTTSLLVVYIISFAVAFLGLLYQVFIKKRRFYFRYIFFGWILGLANFGNILFYLKAHQSLAQNPGTVFTAMNIGVITAGTIIGASIFKEKLSRLNIAGIVLAILAIVLIAYSSFYAV